MYDILELVSRSYFLLSDKQGGQDVNDRQNVVSTFQCVQQSNNVAISLKLRGERHACALLSEGVISIPSGG